MVLLQQKATRGAQILTKWHWFQGLLPNAHQGVISPLECDPSFKNLSWSYKTEPTYPFILSTNITDKKMQANMPNSCVHIKYSCHESLIIL